MRWVTAVSNWLHKLDSDIYYVDVYRPAVEERLPDVWSAKNAVIILRSRGLEHMGSTVIKWLETFHANLEEGGNWLMLAGVHPLLKEELEHAKVLEIIGEENIFLAQPGFGAAEDEALLAAEKWLADHPADAVAEADSSIEDSK